MNECSICRCDFDLDAEGGIEGWIGIIPIAFCPTCKAGIYDFAMQTWFFDDREDFYEKDAIVTND